jgi:hypothetical protein
MSPTDHPARAVDALVEKLDLKGMGFEGMTPAAPGRPAYHPAMPLKLCVHAYLNKVQPSRRQEPEAQRIVELTSRDWMPPHVACCRRHPAQSIRLGKREIESSDWRRRAAF